MSPVIVIPTRLWELTWARLAQDSQGVRESACVWAGERLKDRWIVQEVAFLDDLCGVRASRLQHRTTRPALEHLFTRLRTGGWQVVADVHTHPGNWVDLSPVDRRHPIEHRIGLVAMVLPQYAAGCPSRDHIGVHDYEGSYQWRRWTHAEVLERLAFSGRETP